MKALSVARSPSGDGLRRDGSKTAEARPRGTSSADPGLRRSRHAGARRERSACNNHATPVGTPSVHEASFMGDIARARQPAMRGTWTRCRGCG